MSEQELRTDLVASFKNRAMIYWHFFDSMRKAVGEARATELLKEAIYRRGIDIGGQFSRYAPHDMAGLRDAFLKILPDGGALFAPEVMHCDATRLDIKFHRCPLKEAWEQAGVFPDDIAKLCDIAGRIDNGTFEAAGFRFHADTWTAGHEGCCYLHIRPAKAS